MHIPEDTFNPVVARPSTIPVLKLSNIGIRAMLPYAALVLVFLLVGLTGHDPWKADEAYVFGIIQEMLDSGDWIVPRLAGEPFMEKPPLFYWTAAGFARLLSRWLPLHDGARVASGFFMSITLCALVATARTWWGAGTGRYAVVIMLAYVGTLVQSHMMMTDVSLLTGFALSALGFAMVVDRPGMGGVLLGLGLGIGFLSKGVIAPAVMGVTMLLLPACFNGWHRRTYWRGMAIAALVSTPWCLLWPVALYMRSPALFMEWFWLNNFGRFFGFSVTLLGAEHLPWFWTETLPWFTFPGLPLALWTLWARRKTALSEPPVQYALVACGILMLVLAAAASGRSIYAWPLLVPITLLAAPAVSRMPKGADRIWAWGSLALFVPATLLVWTGWVIMIWNDAPPNWPILLRVLPAEYVPHLDALSATAAALITMGAVAGWRGCWGKSGQGILTWTIGMTLSWSVLTTLWLPWLDFAKSYRSVFAAMPIPATTNCIASHRFGEGERAMLRYVSGYNAVRLERSPKADCTTLLLQREASEGAPEIDRTKWKELWRGARPGATNERFWLFQFIESDVKPGEAIRQPDSTVSDWQ